MHSQALTVPEPLQAVAAATGVDALKFVLTGGEDHALVGTFEPADVPEGWTVIGSVAEGNEETPGRYRDGGRRAVRCRVRSRPLQELRCCPGC